MESKSKSYRISTADARHVRPLLEAIVKDNKGWSDTLSKTDCTLKWVNKSTEDVGLLGLLADGFTINRYPSVHYLSRKDTFSTLTNL